MEIKKKVIFIIYLEKYLEDIIVSYNKQTGMYEGYIYCIENLVNNKKYIGYTKNDINTRWYQHLSKTHHKEDNSILHLAIDKYNEHNFKVYSVCILYNETIDGLIEELKKAERYYITEYDTITPNGYNILSGGESVPISRRTQVYQYTMDGILIRSYNSITEAIQINGFNDHPRHSKIGRCIKTSHYAFGYLWDVNINDDIVNLYNTYMNNRYKRSLNQSLRIKNSNTKRSKSVICTTTQEIFETVHDACDKYNIHASALIAVCDHKRYSCGKHPITNEKLVWEYVDDVYI